jgi:hypothetical protein
MSISHMQTLRTPLRDEKGIIFPGAIEAGYAVHPASS